MVWNTFDNVIVFIKLITLSRLCRNYGFRISTKLRCWLTENVHQPWHCSSKWCWKLNCVCVLVIFLLYIFDSYVLFVLINIGRSFLLGKQARWERCWSAYLSDHWHCGLVKKLVLKLVTHPSFIIIHTIMHLSSGVAKAFDTVKMKFILMSTSLLICWWGPMVRDQHMLHFYILSSCVDVLLSLPLQGNVLRNECSGQVIMKTQLSGMPECKVSCCCCVLFCIVHI